MIVVGENLKGLIDRHEMAPPASYDGFSITLTLHGVVFEPLAGKRPLTYPVDDPAEFFSQKSIPSNKSLEIAPGKTVLACSKETIRMPLGFLGFLQTKGSLARLMCAVHMNDAQVEPGFNGRITFEIANHAPFPIAIRVGAPVSQLFVFGCTDKSAPGYQGRYGNSDIPTLFKPSL